MAKKSSKKTSDDVIESSVASEPADAAEEVVVAAAEEPVTSKSKPKPAEDASANGNVGISDIRKAVAFVNSVGGLDKALGLLQILKVAREVQ